MQASNVSKNFMQDFWDKCQHLGIYYMWCRIGITALEKVKAKSLVLFKKISFREIFIIMKFNIDTSNQTKPILLNSLNQTEFDTLDTYLDQKLITLLNSWCSKRKLERPLLRWLDGVEKDLKVPKITNWKISSTQ